MTDTILERLWPPRILDTRSGGLLVATIVLLALPFVLGKLVASQILVFAIFAIGLNVLMGYGGEMSFGHAAFFGLGAYGLVFTTQQFANVYVGIIVGVLVATLAGVVFGWLSLRRRGIYFGMITLALGMMLYVAAFNLTGITGGSSGMRIPFEIEAFGPFDPGAGGLAFYALALFTLGAVWLGVRRIVHSPYGRILIAIRENEMRARSLGYDADRFLFIAFVVSSFIGGLAGVLYGLLFSFVTPNLLFWSVSGEVVLMTIIGGVGTMAGPVIGAGIFVFLSNNLTSIFDVWGFFFGVIIVIFVLFAPEGIYGLYLDKRGDGLGDGWRVDRVVAEWVRQLRE